MAEDEVTQPKQPTAAEAMFFYIIVKHMKTKADVDWEGVAQEHGFKNAEVAKVRFGQVKRKLGMNNANVSPSKSPTKARTTTTSSASPTKVKKTTAGRVGAKGGPVKRASSVKKSEEAGEGADFVMPPRFCEEEDEKMDFESLMDSM